MINNVIKLASAKMKKTAAPLPPIRKPTLDELIDMFDAGMFDAKTSLDYICQAGYFPEAFMQALSASRK